MGNIGLELRPAGNSVFGPTFANNRPRKLYSRDRVSQFLPTRPAHMKISIIVPAFNEEKLLRDSLKSIRAAASQFDDREWAWELIVCDNNSTDKTPVIAHEEGAVVVFEPINQISRARNRGAAAAKGEWMLFIDADSHPSAQLLGEVAEQIETGRALAGGSTLRMDEGGLSLRCVNGLWNVISRVTRWAAGSFIWVEAGAFREIGGFSDELYASEELDLFARLKRLARRRRKRVIILTRHPMVTSARKVKLYTPGELLGILWKTVVGFGRPLKDKEACHMWYDGRR